MDTLSIYKAVKYSFPNEVRLILAKFKVDITEEIDSYIREEADYYAEEVVTASITNSSGYPYSEIISKVDR